MLDPLADQHRTLATETTAVLFLGGRRFHHRTHSRFTALVCQQRANQRLSVDPVPPPHGILKENLLWARTFDTLEQLRAALVEFARHYNETWLVARHGYRTPAQVRAAQSQLDQNAMADLKLAA